MPQQRSTTSSHWPPCVSQFYAKPAASTRIIRKRSSRKPDSGVRRFPTSFRTTGGVSSTVKLSVSKTELLGSNPSSPASLPGTLQSGNRHQHEDLRQHYGQDNSSNRTTQHRPPEPEAAASSPRRVPQ